MHELSIVMSIIDSVERSAEAHKATIIHEVEIEAGQLSGVEFDALEFALSNAPREKMFEKTVFTVHKIIPEARCNKCGHRFTTDSFANPCPQCSATQTELVKGTELRIKSYSFD